MWKEQTAKERIWCPLSRVLVMHAVHVDAEHQYVMPVAMNRKDDQPYGKCIGSDCAMWRWNDLDHKRGYCGYAGRPEFT